jgi:hypothetical protein
MFLITFLVLMMPTPLLSSDRDIQIILRYPVIEIEDIWINGDLDIVDIWA